VALSSTIYNVHVELSDIDRGVYESFELKVARHPSESDEYLVARIFAYCLEFTEGIELTQGVAAVDEPAVVVRDLTGRLTAWIEVGMPDADRLHRASKAADRVAVYTQKDPRQLLGSLAGKKIHKAEAIRIHSLDRAFVDSVARKLDRRTKLSLSVTERQLYANVNGADIQGELHEHTIPS
jgi:uncharacterized protein YaeQ